MLGKMLWAFGFGMVGGEVCFGMAEESCSVAAVNKRF